jgi:hypothetical protein
MAGEPDNLVLVQLREIRATQDEIRATQQQHTKRFDNGDKQFEELRGFVLHALGLGSMNTITNERPDAAG